MHPTPLLDLVFASIMSEAKRPQPVACNRTSGRWDGASGGCGRCPESTMGTSCVFCGPLVSPGWWEEIKAGWQGPGLA